MTLNPTAVAPNPRYRGAKPRERETQERELEIERTKQGRKRGDYSGMNSILSESVKDDEENQMIALRAMEAEDDEEIIDGNEGSRIIFSSGIKRDGGGDEGGGDEQFLQINRLQQHASSEKRFNRDNCGRASGIVRVLEIDLSYESLSYVKVAYMYSKLLVKLKFNKFFIYSLEIRNLSLNFSPVISISLIRVTVEWYCKMSWGES
ncbi:hypothetical protein ALC57_14342 [Trachymyrmex cornetzi]|uniref:Uncharacterized protein n=1 Tax=Trachymyrmex cornetzi TaxID=471704 RepID=A0A195DLF3_9HYME|nr:hypothetical protein ALC57_14342 [Trachymyrmex cornetzi]